MSLCLGQFRRVVCNVDNKQVVSVLSNSFSASPSFVSGFSALAPGYHSFHPTDSTKKTFSSKAGKQLSNVGSYQARKDAAKQKRREAWERKMQRLESLQTRRDGKNVGYKKNLFRSWWDKEMIYHDVLRRKAKKEGKPWKIRVAAMVERLPVVIPDLEPWEREYHDLKAYYLSFGKEYPPELGFMPEPKPSDHEIKSDEEMLEMLPFTPAPRETEADKNGDVKTLDRRLKTRVYLTVRTDQEGNKSGPRWTLPSTIVKNDETLLAAAERAVSDSVGNDLVLWCPSNCPMAVNLRVYNTNLPADFRENYFGEKIFYYRVQHDKGDVNEESLTTDDYAWLTREEIVERVEKERGSHQAKFFHYML